MSPESPAPSHPSFPQRPLDPGAEALIHALGLAPHPEGGWFRELYRSSARVAARGNDRSAVTTIYYLLERHQVSRWHTVESDEIWHFYAGAGLELLAYDPASERLTNYRLGAPSDARPVAVIPAGTWQAARSLGAYSLVGCSVAPGFEFADFRFVAARPDHARHFAERLRGLESLL